MKFTDKLMVAAGLMVLTAVTSCNQSNELVPETPAENPTLYPFQAKMVLEGGVQHHDETRASTGWQDGDIIYLQFINSSDTIGGMASYNSLSDSWHIQCTEEPPTGDDTRCEAYYFADEENESYSTIGLSQRSSIYAEKAGAYTFADGVVNVKAVLKPMTGRIRFQGTEGTTFTVGGIYYYSGYNIQTNTFEIKHTSTLNTIGSDGYSPYIYGSFPNDKRKVMYVGDEKDSILYTQNMKMTCMAPGHSGCMQMPTQASHVGWRAQEYVKEFTVNGVSFKMILVHGGTFNMGATKEQYLYNQTPENDEFPIHEVTLSTYYIGETEVLNELWETVTGKSLNLNDQTKKLSIHNKSYSECESFATQLSLITGMPFRLPTEAEWEFAARGGCKSKSFMYAGSSFRDMVMIYESSPYDPKSYAPNELGIYGMTGGASEWCADWYGEYPSISQIDPIGPATGERHVLRGGDYFNDAFRISQRRNSQTSCSGLRLAL